MSKTNTCKNCIWRKGRWCEYLQDDVKLDEEACGRFAFEPNDGPVNKFFSMLERNDVKVNKEKLLRDINTQTAHQQLMDESLKRNDKRDKEKRYHNESNKAQRMPGDGSKPTE